ncbi:hypothetical protein pipiens_006115 [Culex pipiens pipiens]|uniref:Uncharacterized protein n=1 Tax=Culex pipiens pipiens TaxID=38569 RepID=A0ABD1DRL3_CULPP
MPPALRNVLYTKICVNGTYYLVFDTAKLTLGPHLVATVPTAEIGTVQANHKTQSLLVFLVQANQVTLLVYTPEPAVSLQEHHTSSDAAPAGSRQAVQQAPHSRLDAFFSSARPQPGRQPLLKSIRKLHDKRTRMIARQYEHRRGVDQAHQDQQRMRQCSQNRSEDKFGILASSGKTVQLLGPLTRWRIRMPMSRTWTSI